MELVKIHDYLWEIPKSGGMRVPGRIYASENLIQAIIKDEVPETIIEAVRGVSRGEQGWVSRRVAAKMAAWTHSEASGKGALTHREVEVLKWVVDGKTNQEIGATLGISEKTVEKHLEAIFRKLGVASRVEAAVLAVKEGIV